ncbi:MAG TPA: CheR family methyltransferase [Solirubrobacteraceae bacterium]
MSAEAVDRVAALIRRESGIVLGGSQLPSLRAAIARVAPGMTADQLLSPQTSPETLERLIDEVTVRETFFFRHRSELDKIDWPGAMRMARARGSNAIRVWIVGCASGEEAYTVAILACEALGASAPVRILATDIAPTALAEARRGCYGNRAVRMLESDIRRRYFTLDSGRLRVGDRLRAMVSVSAHNLVRDRIPPLGWPPFDLILCRNVLIYFDQQTVDRLVVSLQAALWPDGRLLLGAADRISGRAVRSPPRVPRRPTRGPHQPAQAGSSSPSPPPARASLPRAKAAAGAGQPAADGEGRRERLSRALQAADRGDLEAALQIAGDALAEDPLDAEAHYITGVAELARDAPQAAVQSLRRALYADPKSSLAAFHLARAHDALGERGPARRAYQQVLRTLELDPQEHSIAQSRDLAAVTNACRSRLQALVGDS